MANEASVTLTKIDTAERQLDTAIWLWFNEGDIVSIIRLTGSTINVLDDLLFHKARKRTIPFVKEYMPEGIEPRDVRAMVKGPQDFGSHARNDADASCEYKDSF